MFRPGLFWIINLAPSTWSNGSHWTLTYAVNAGTLFYFDSFGQVPPLDVLRCATRYRLRLVYNRHDEQGLRQESCAYFACAVARWLLAKVPFDVICTQKLHPSVFVANQRVVVAEAPVA